MLTSSRICASSSHRLPYPDLSRLLLIGVPGPLRELNLQTSVLPWQDECGNIEVIGPGKDCSIEVEALLFLPRPHGWC
jgi:hypothetical protein